MKLSLNINDRFVFKLTQHGEERLRAHYSVLRRDHDAVMKAAANGGFPTFDQFREWKMLRRDDPSSPFCMYLWEIMHIFGPHIFNGSRQVIVDNVIWMETRP